MSFDEDNPPLPETPEAAQTAPGARELAGAHQALPADLRAPWGWLDLFVLAVLATAGSFLIGLSLAAVFAAFGIKPAQLRASPGDTGLFTIVHQALLSVVLLLFLAAHIRVSFGAPFWRTIGWRALQPGQLPRALRYLGFLLGGFLLAVAVQVASIAFGSNAKVPMQELFQDRRTAILLLLMAVFVAPVIEETIFRGYIYPIVARSWGVAPGILATGVLFGLLHAPQLWGGWVQIALLVIVGIVFTCARAITQTVLASYLLHVSYNFSVSFAFLLGSHWLRLVSPGR
ncbi:MAG TPA: type II CAAX endopeptidase family protein [Candidatus Acidoferrales bacterium]